MIKTILLFIFSFMPTILWAATLNVSEVTIKCENSDRCSERKSRFTNLSGEYRSVVHLKDTLRVVASDGGYRSFAYRLLKINKTHHLIIEFELKPLIREVSVGFVDRSLEADPLQLLSLKEGDYFEVQRLHENISLLKRKLEALGYPHNKPVLDVVEKPSGVDVNVVITLGPPLIFKSIRTNAKSTFVAEFLTKKFYNLYNKPFELNRFKVYLDAAQKELFSYGYYLIGLDFTSRIKNNRVILDIKVTNDNLFAFDLRGLKKEDRDVIQALMVDLFRKYKRPLTESNIKQAIKEHYRKTARLEADAELETTKFETMYKEKATLYRISVEEGVKTRLLGINFIGNTYYSSSKLQSFFDRDAFELASIGYFDEDYFRHFVDLLRNRYIKNGFVQVKIQGPNYNFSHGTEKVTVDYNIFEGQRAYVRSIALEGLPIEFEQDILEKLQNKKGSPFNPISLVDDIREVTEFLQNKGYYYAEITNINDDNFVRYSRSGADVDLNFRIITGPLVRLNRIILLGNNKTRKKVILKKITLDEGDLITPAKTREIESRLSAMGLFNTVQVSPLRHNSSNTATDLIIRLYEREFGLVEVAPGYRTDLGLKLSTTVSYLNIGGMNRSVQLKGQVNMRDNFTTINDKRPASNKQLLEYNTTATFIQGDMFDTLIDYSASVSQQRRRFFAFDADIQRINNTFTRDLTRNLSGSIRHQLEKINQFNSESEDQNGSFRIGAISPSFTWDLRNSQINPVSGAFFNFSAELANPLFLSQDSSDLTINYFKLISRNRFYIPFRNGTVAISIAAGAQQNLAQDKIMENGAPVIIQERDENENVVNTLEKTKGFIPPIKVFRLSGMDIVRGYADDEINRIDDGRDISQVRIQNQAFMTNFKLEPRYFLTDSLMGGIFFDAGRVYVDQVDLGELRTSAGLTFKVVTPVGTLDFDYGIKLLRKKLPNGRLEDPGRFHVSIGFF
jgi:outer membrane protein insertion porin family